MKLIVKVDTTRATDPARHVTDVLRDADAGGSQVEEVFPGLRSGASAGLVTVTLPEKPDVRTRRATMKALREDSAISYVNTPKPRRAR
jgi:hypothetical protein